MPLPASSEARLFYQAAKQRFEDARFLLENGSRTTAAVYLAGYFVECMLKAMILSRVPAKQRSEIVASFRGAKAHDFGWLKAKYLQVGGTPFPSHINSLFRVYNWSTDIRYKPGAVKQGEAGRFLQDAETFLVFGDERL